MNVRQHQYLDLGVVAIFFCLCLESVLLGNGVLDILSIMATSVMTGSIVIGVFLAAYIKITKRQIFDPLDSELDEDPTEGDGLRPS